MTQISQLESAVLTAEFSEEKIAKFRAIMEKDLGKPVFASEEELAQMMRNGMYVVLQLGVQH